MQIVQVVQIVQQIEQIVQQIEQIVQLVQIEQIVQIVCLCSSATHPLHLKKRSSWSSNGDLVRILQSTNINILSTYI